MIKIIKFPLFITMVLLTIYLGNNSCGSKKTLDSGDLKAETTIRNSSKTTITYWIKVEGAAGEADEKTLKPGEVHRYPGDELYEVTYQSKNESVTELLPSNSPYTFRQDDELSIRLYPGSHGRSDAEDLGPYVPTEQEIVEKMLAMVQLNNKDVLFDLGCGDGRIVIAAAKKFKLKGVGIEINPELIRKCRENARQAGVEALVTFIEQDIAKIDISAATVVTIYLLPEANALIRPQLENQLTTGTYIICHNYPIPGWDEKEIKYQLYEDKGGNTHSLILYRK